MFIWWRSRFESQHVRSYMWRKKLCPTAAPPPPLRSSRVSEMTFLLDPLEESEWQRRVVVWMLTFQQQQQLELLGHRTSLRGNGFPPDTPLLLLVFSLLLFLSTLFSCVGSLECVSAIAMFVFSFPVDMAPVSGLGWYTIGISYKSSSSFSLPHSWRFPFHLMGIQCGCLLIWINTSIIIIIHFIWLTSTPPPPLLKKEWRGPDGGTPKLIKCA